MAISDKGLAKLTGLYNPTNLALAKKRRFLVMAEKWRAEK